MTAIVPASDSPIVVPPFQPATRKLTGLLSRLEARCLPWLARRIPTSINSDYLTSLALVATIGAGGSYWFARHSPAGLLLAVICLALNWFGDSLDGTVARVRQQQRPRYGFYVDHVVDVLGAAAVLVGLGLSGYMNLVVALSVLVVYLMVCVELFLTTYCLGMFTLSHLGVGPTELRLLLAVGTITVRFHPMATIAGYSFRLFDVGGVVSAGGLLAIFLWSAACHSRRLYLAEPIPPRADAR